MEEFAVVILPLAGSSDSLSSCDSSTTSDPWAYDGHPLPWYSYKFGYEDTVSLEFRLKLKLARAKYFLSKLNPWRKEVRMVSNFEHRPSDDQVALPKPKTPPSQPRLTVYPVLVYPANFNPATWPKFKQIPAPRIRLVSVPIPIPAKPVQPIELTFAPSKEDDPSLEVPVWKRIPAPDVAYEPTEDGFCPWFD